MTNKTNLIKAIEAEYNAIEDYDAWFFNGHEESERYDYARSIYCGLVYFLNDMTEKQIEDFAEMDDEDKIEWLNDEAFISDTVTGNASGSFFFNSWKAESAICHNWYLIEETQDEFGTLEFSRGAEYIDVSIRCYMLSQVISDVIEAIEDRISEIEDEAEHDFAEEQTEQNENAIIA